MAKPRMTDQEKMARGTFQPSRATKPRPLANIETAITDASDLLDSLADVLKQAQRSVRKDGIQITVTTRNNKNETVTSSKLNPAVALLLKTPHQIRAMRRELVLLNAERDAVLAKEAAASAPDEFAGLV